MYNAVPPIGHHPRALFGPGDVADLRAKMRHPDCRATWERLLAACEGMLNPAPDPLFVRHIRPSHLAFAYLITGREEFARAAVAQVMPLVHLPHYADANAHKMPFKVRVGLRTGHVVAEACLTYDWAHDFYTPEQRRTLREHVKEKGLDAAVLDYREETKHSRWYTCNGIMVAHGPLLMASILFEHEIDTRDAFELCLHQTRSAIDAHCVDGGYPEGPLYWNYCLRHMLHGVEPLRRHKGIDLYQEPFLRSTCDYPLHFILPWLTSCLNAADSLQSTHLWAPIAALASYHQKPQWQWLARRLITHDWGRDGEGLEYSLMFLIYYQPELPAAEPPMSEAVHLFSGLQQMSLRSDWSNHALHMVWLNGPSNCHHNHLHLNSITLSAFGKPLLIEQGKYDYADNADYRKTTAGHNSLLIDGEGQIITTDTAISCQRLRAGMWGTVYGEFQCLRDEAGATIATGHTVNAYHGRLRAFDRTIAFVERRFFFLHDFVELEKQPPAELTWLFHAGGEVVIEPSSYLFTTGDANLRIVPLPGAVAMTAAVHTDHKALDSERTFDPYLLLTHRCMGRRADWFALLVPFESGREPSATIERKSAEEVVFMFEGRRWVYHIDRRTLRCEGA